MRTATIVSAFLFTTMAFAANPPKEIADAIAVLKDTKAKNAAKVAACETLQAKSDDARPALEQLLISYDRSTDQTLKTAILDATKQIDKQVYEAMLGWPAIPPLSKMKMENVALFRDFIYSAARRWMQKSDAIYATAQKQSDKNIASDLIVSQAVPCVKAFLDHYPKDTLAVELAKSALEAKHQDFRDLAWQFIRVSADKTPFGDTLVVHAKRSGNITPQMIHLLEDARGPDNAKVIDEYLASLRNSKDKVLRETVDEVRDRIATGKKRDDKKAEQEKDVPKKGEPTKKK